MRISDWSSDVCSSDLTVEPDTKVRPLLERGVPRSFHCPAKRKRCSMCIEQSQIIPLGSDKDVIRSEEHTSELQSLMRISYAVFCLKKKKKKTTIKKRQPKRKQQKKQQLNKITKENTEVNTDT